MSCISSNKLVMKSYIVLCAIMQRDDLTEGETKWKRVDRAK